MAGFRPNWRALLVALPPVVAALWLWGAFVEDMGTGEATWTAVAAAGLLCVLSVAEDAWEHWRGRRRGGDRGAGGDRGGEAQTDQGPVSVRGPGPDHRARSTGP